MNMNILDLNEVGVEELRQFPNLEEATIISSNFEHVKAVFDEAGIDVELLWKLSTGEPSFYLIKQKIEI